MAGSVLRRADSAARRPVPPLHRGPGHIIARLERADSNPTVQTVQRALHAAGRRLELHGVVTGFTTVDEGLIRDQLALSPADRIRALDRQNATVSALMSRTRRHPAA